VLHEASTGKHRELFATMTKMLRVEAVAAKPATAKLIWQSLIKSFVIVQDFHGVLIALRAGVYLWGMEPDNTILREVTLGVLRARRYTKEEGSRPVITKPAMEQSVENLRKAGERLMERKKGRMAAFAAKRALVGGNLESLSELLTSELSRRPGYGPEVFIRGIRAAKQDMGVSNLVIEW
jgi:hypothetical protein